uniref:Succinate dehydrogenase [ubiquinone] cytochrome b small subunit n=1 Tax=Photinus pyralis TaxID=7054 RepID=A0A1Y1LUH6_PHOPY
MALSIALRHANKFQGYSTLSKCLLPFYNNAASVTCASTHTSDFNKPLLRNGNISILPAVRFLTTPNTIFSNVNKSAVIAQNVRKMSGEDHRALWKIEKGISALLVGLLPACVAFPNPVLDNLTAILTVAHLHWGMEAIAQDYCRPILVGNAVSKVALLAVYVLTTTTLGGLLFFNYSDIGIGKFVRAVWALQG